MEKLLILFIGILLSAILGFYIFKKENRSRLIIYLCFSIFVSFVFFSVPIQAYYQALSEVPGNINEDAINDRKRLNAHARYLKQHLPKNARAIFLYQDNPLLSHFQDLFMYPHVTSNIAYRNSATPYRLPMPNPSNTNINAREISMKTALSGLKQYDYVFISGIDAPFEETYSFIFKEGKEEISNDCIYKISYNPRVGHVILSRAAAPFSSPKDHINY